MMRILAYCLLPLLVTLGLLTICQHRLAEINSDALYIPSLYKDLFVDHYDISRWNLTLAPYFFPDMVILFFLIWITPDIGNAFVIYSILFFLLFLMILIKITLIVNKNKFNAFICTFSAGLLLIALMQDSNYAYLSLIFLIPSYHGGTTLIGLILVAIFLSVIQKGYSWASATLLFILSFVAILSDIIIIPQFLLPLIIVTFIFWLFRIIKFRILLISVALIITAKFIAAGLLKIFELMNIFHNPQVISLPQNVDFIKKQFLAVIHAIDYSLKINTLLYVIFAGWLTVSVVLLVKYWYFLFFSGKKQTNKCKKVHFVLFLSLFFLFSFLGTIAASIISIVWMDYFSIRYLQPLYILPLFFLAIILATYNEKRAFWLKVASFSAVFIFSLYQVVPGIKTLEAANLRLPYPKQVQCLDELATNYGLQYGYSDYWNAKYMTMLSRSGVHVNQLTPDLHIDNWINNSAWYANKIGKVGGQYPKYQFILTNRLPKEKIEQKFGRPAVQHDCQGTEIYIYNRQSDVAFRNFLRIPAIMADGRKVPSSLLSPEGLGRYTPNGTPWNATGTVIIPENGQVAVRFDQPVTSGILEIAADNNDEYAVDFFMNGTFLGQLFVPVTPEPGMQARYLPLPKPMSEQPFDRLVVRPLHGDGAYSVGHIFLYEDS